MWGWLKALGEGIFNSIIGALTDWWAHEEAEAAKSQAKARDKQLESVKTGMQVQAEMARKTAAAATSAPKSGAGWNAAPLLLACLLLQGCGLFRFEVYTHPYQPVPPRVDRPVLEDESPFNDREQVLATYATSLEAALNEARAYSIEQNQAQGYPVDPADAEWLAAYRSQ